MLSGGGEHMSTITSIETISEKTNQLHNLNDVQHLFDRILQADHLFINRDQLRSAYIPEILPHREKETTELADILSPVLNYETPSNILLFGKPGVGKTAVTKLVGGELQKQGKELGKHIHFIYVNCQLSNTLYKILQHISQKLTSKQDDMIPSSGLPVDVLFTKIVSLIDKQKQMLIITLDEVDKIQDDITLYTLTRINESLTKTRLSIICISNNLRFADSLDARVKSSLSQETMVFNPYDAQQLQDILRTRCQQALTPNILTDDVIPLCAALAAQEHGDARRALDLLRVSIELAERKHDRNVTTKHVRLAQSKIEKDRIAEVIHSLPAQQRLVLHAISILQQHHERMKQSSAITTGEVFNQYTELSKTIKYTALTQRRVADFISELDTLGIITAREISKGRRGRTREIEISMSSKELEQILQKDELSEEIKQQKMKMQMRLI